MEDFDPLDISLPPLTSSKWLPEFVALMRAKHNQAVLPIVHEIPFFNGISDESMVQKLIPRMKMRWFPINSSVFEEGWSGSEFYIVVAGRVKVTVSVAKDKDNPAELELGQLGRCAYFGEIALLENKPRTATVTCCSPCVLLSLNKEDLEFISRSESALHQTLHSMLTVRSPTTLRNLNIPCFVGFSDDQFKALSRAAKLTSYSFGTKIFRIGDMGRKFYILIDGSVDIIGKDGNVIKIVRNRQTFGEMSLVKVAPVTADAVITSEKAVCVEIEYDDFKSIKFDNAEDEARCHLVIMGRRADLATVLNHKLAYDSFEKHCEKEFSVENIHFWASVRQFNALVVEVAGDTVKEEGRERVHQLFREIYEKYIAEGAASQINIPSKMQKELKAFLSIDNNSKFSDLSGVFEKADAEIFKLMERDSLPTFRWSPAFQDILARISPFHGLDLSTPSPQKIETEVLNPKGRRTARKSMTAQNLLSSKKQSASREAVITTSFSLQPALGNNIDDGYNY